MASAATPTAVQPARQRALVVPDKAQRVYNFHRNTINALAEMLAATGLSHPRELGPHPLSPGEPHGDKIIFADPPLSGARQSN